MSNDITAATGDQVVPADGAGTELVETETAGAYAVVRRGDRGMVSAEWAMGIIAAVAIAGVLLAVVTNGAVEHRLLGFILDVIDKIAKGLR